jgi:hypothetical protein
MPVWVALLGALGWNYARHRRGKSTLCSSTRHVVPDLGFCAGWGVLTGWMIPHYCRRK